MGLGRLAALGGWSPVLLVVVVVCLPTCQLANLPTFRLSSFSTCWKVGELAGCGRGRDVLAALGGGLPRWCGMASASSAAAERNAAARRRAVFWCWWRLQGAVTALCSDCRVLSSLQAVGGAPLLLGAGWDELCTATGVWWFTGGVRRTRRAAGGGGTGERSGWRGWRI